MFLAVDQGIAAAFPDEDHLIARMVHASAAASRRDFLDEELQRVDAWALEQRMHVPFHHSLLVVLLRQLVSLYEPHRLFLIFSLLVAEAQLFIPQVAIIS